MSFAPMPPLPPAGGGGGGLPAARLTDAHTCPAHVGGPVLSPGAPKVFIEGHKAARVGDLCKCETGPPDPIAKGSPTVFIGGLMAARQTDTTAHGGVIVGGAARTFIGNGAGAGSAADCMQSAADHGSATVSFG